MKEKTKSLIACALLFVGLVSMAVGIYRGENMTVENKAINICMECIGIG